MSEMAILRDVLFAAELFVGSSLIVALARLAVSGRSASARHLVWSAAFGALLSLPVLMAILPGALTILLPAPPQVAMTPSAVVADVSVAPQSYGFAFDATAIAYALTGIWLAGVVLIALRGVASIGALWVLRRSSTAHPFEPAELSGLPQARGYDLRIAKGGHGPITWGVLHPVILLPRAALFWPSERLEAVLRHELAHISRHDSLTQTLSLAVCALYWPNPLVWLARGIQRRDAEMAADDAVLAGGMTPSDYAGELLSVAAEAGRNRLPVAMALFMAAPPQLPARVQAILAPSHTRKGVTAMDILKIAGVALLTTSALVVARPSFAQDAPPAPPAMTAPDAPPVPPVPPMPDVAPIPPVPPLHAGHGYRIVRSMRDGHGNKHVSMIVVDDPNDVVTMSDPEIGRAMARVKADDVLIRRVQAMRPQIDAEVERAMARARAALAQADDARIRAKVDEALARVQQKLAAAQARIARDNANAVRDGQPMPDEDATLDDDEK